MKSVKQFVLTAFSLVLLTICNSCGQSADDFQSSLDAVPDNAHFIAVVDKAALADNAGEFVPADMLATLEAISAAGEDATDQSAIAIFTLPKGYTLCAIKVLDVEKLENALESCGKRKDANYGYDIFECGGRKVAVGHSVCLISPDVKSLKVVAKQRRPEISAIEGVREYLSNPDETVKSASIASDIYGKQLEGLWLCRSMHFTDTSVSVDFSLMKPGGESGQIGKQLADPIDPDVLGFIPDGCSLVAATGKQQEGAKMFGIESLLRSYIPMELNLSPIGTTAWYARPAGRLNPDDLLAARVWNFASVSQTSQSEGEETILSLMAQTANRARKDPATGCYSFSIGGIEGAFGYLNGYTAISLNGDISYGNSNSYTQDFAGARMVVLVDIPKGSQLQQAAGLPCGASLNVKVTTDNLHAKVRFYGNTLPALPTLNQVTELQGVLPLLMGLKN